LPAIPGTRLASRYRSGDTGADIGGDFYDLWPTGTGWSVVLGDVSGKGVVAAVVTGQARHTVRGAAHLDPSPAAVLDALNAQLVAGGSGRFVTAVYGHAVAHPDGGWELEVGSADRAGGGAGRGRRDGRRRARGPAPPGRPRDRRGAGAGMTDAFVDALAADDEAATRDRAVLTDADRWLVELFTARGHDPALALRLWLAVRDTVGELLPLARADLAPLATRR